MLAAARAPEKPALPENYAWNWYHGCLGTQGADMSSKKNKKNKRLIEIAVELSGFKSETSSHYNFMRCLSYPPEFLSFEKQRRFNKNDRWRCNLRGITRNVCPPFVQFLAHHRRGNGSYVSAREFKTLALDLPTPRPFNTCTLEHLEQSGRVTWRIQGLRIDIFFARRRACTEVPAVHSTA